MSPVLTILGGWEREVVWKMQGTVSDSHPLLCWNWNALPDWRGALAGWEAPNWTLYPLSSPPSPLPIHEMFYP